MKKILSLLASMVAIVVLFTACSKSPDKLLDRKDGKWNAIMTSTVTYNGVVQTNTEIATFIFDDSKVTYIDSYGDVETGTWSATKDKVIIILDGDATAFDVITSKKKLQEWEFNESFEEQGLSVNMKLQVKLTR